VRAAVEVCLEHGNTFTSSGGQTWCRAAGCGRRWCYDRLGGPCPPLDHRRRGRSVTVCAGHALAAREQLINGTVAPLR